LAGDFNFGNISKKIQVVKIQARLVDFYKHCGRASIIYRMM
jgi:hypothetical protein